MVREIEKKPVPGPLMVIVLIIAAAAIGFGFSSAVQAQAAFRMGAFGFAGAVWALAAAGFLVVNPNQGKALQLFGSYAGTVKAPGLWWTSPFYTKREVSLRVRNFETAKLKVNDHASNPIEIGAVVVWQVFDTAEALFEVDNFDDYVRVQSESALRGLANQYPYDSHDGAGISLSGSTGEVAEKLKSEIQERLARAGVKVLEARISHLAYAQEIASAMLRRQQAGAIIAARQLIVEGAVGMVEQALDHLSKRQIVQLDEERKAAMVSNLLVVLCSDHSAQPVVNAGTLYQ
jgi:regulator of protease activity HflC (stomatin/prohibitin superfamily)